MLRSGWVPLYIPEHNHTVTWNITQIYMVEIMEGKTPFSNQPVNLLYKKTIVA